MSTPFAIQQLAKKLRLEANFKPKLTKFFREISRSITPVLRVTGQVPSLRSFNEDLIVLLEKHYAKVAKEFRGDVAPELTKSFVEQLEIKQDEVETILEESESDINKELAAIIAVKASRQAQFILDTTEKELRQSMEKISVQAARDGERLTLAEQGRRTARDFNKKIPGKVEGISVYQTQAMAEDTKLTEAETISTSGAIIAGVSAAIAMKKVWNSILDEVTRDWHVPADLQVRSLSQPFNVKGQLLRVPGDTSLGASLDNVLGCRCSASYQLGATV